MAKRKTSDIRNDLVGAESVQRRSPQQMLSTGLTTLNLALSGTSLGGIPQGCVAHYAGDSDSGKTVLAMMALAEASINKNFNNHDLRFWNAEDGAQMDRELFYGPGVAKRLIEEVPESLDECYFSVLEALKKKPFVGVIDSMDILVPKSWDKKLIKDKKALKDENIAGDFGTAKAKMNSEYLRKIRSLCSRTGSILILVSQVRDNIGGGPFGDKKSISGGRAYKFYSIVQVLTSTRQTLYKTVLGKPRAYGIQAQLDVKKNHISGKKAKVLAPILNDRGFDDVGANIDFLTGEGYWECTAKDMTKGRIIAPEFSDKKLSRDKLISLIEGDDREKEVRQLVRRVWLEIEEGLKTNRKSRYE